MEVFSTSLGGVGGLKPDSVQYFATPGPTVTMYATPTQSISSNQCGDVTSVAPTGYVLAWNDEFNSNTLDIKYRWQIETSTLGNGGNSELQQYLAQPENISVNDGILALTARKETVNTTSNNDSVGYTSAKIYTKGKYAFRFGRIDVCAKLPKGKGMWPAAWLLPEASIPTPQAGNHSADSLYFHSNWWPINGEIDIMEMIGGSPNRVDPAKPTSDSIVYGSLNFGELWPKNSYTYANYKLSSGTFNDAYHLFSVLWERDRITWYVDNKPFPAASSDPNYASAPVPVPVSNVGTVRTPSDLSYACRSSTNSSQPFTSLCPWPFNDHDFYIILNLAVGGSWPGNPDNSIFPQTMEVDFVRVYQGH